MYVPFLYTILTLEELHDYLHPCNIFLPGIWSSPVISGTRPPPCSAFSFTMVDDYRVVLFGGNQGPKETNDVYILDLTRMASI